MITRGITTTGADYWAHLFPEAETLHWYPAVAVRAWLKDKPGAWKDGHSKDGVVTGRGFLLPKDAPFVLRTTVPERMLAEFDWPRATDRQRGMWGEEVVYWMLLTGAIRPPVWAVRRLETEREQYDMGDFELALAPRPVFEVKTEGADYAQSLNVFVQIEEGGHRVHLARVGGEVVTNVTALPAFKP